MEQLKYVQLLLISKQTKSSNLFQFSPTKNLITADNNGLGKSTLVQSLLWTFGCDIGFDNIWKSLDVSCLIEFTLNKESHKIYRDESGIYYASEDEKRYYPNITGEYSKFFASLVGFDLLLTNRNNELETPPPAFYFLPYYVNQATGWNDTWNGFESLSQFANWQTSVIKFHTGYVKREYFEIERQILGSKKLQENSQEKIKKLDSTVETINELVPSHNFTFKIENWDEVENDLKMRLNDLLKNEAKWARKLSQFQSDKYFLEQQLKYINEAIADLQADYIFATEHLEDNIVCPTCGVKHDNSLIPRASILAEKTQMIDEQNNLEGLIKQQDYQIEELNNQLKSIRLEIGKINEKYDL